MNATAPRRQLLGTRELAELGHCDASQRERGCVFTQRDAFQRRQRIARRGRSQLAVYHFMLTPGSDHICPGCSFTVDHVDAARQHFEQADLAFTAVSREPLQRIEEVKSRMGWTFPWVSSHGSDFNFDFGVSFTPEDLAAGRAHYNYGTVIRNSQDMFGTSIFVKDDKGAVFHTYSTHHRGTERLMGAFNWLDLAPKGRNETSGTMSWVRLHDEY